MPAGTYVVVYADGRRTDIPVAYGEAIRAVDDPANTRSAQAAWSGIDSSGERVAAQAFRWRNPRPAEPIRSLVFDTVDPVASPMLLAVSGISG